MAANSEFEWVCVLVAASLGVGGCGGEGTTLQGGGDTGGTGHAHAGAAGAWTGPGGAGTPGGALVAGAPSGGAAGGNEPGGAGGTGTPPGGAGPVGGPEGGAGGEPTGGGSGEGSSEGGSGGSGGAMAGGGAGGGAVAGAAGEGGAGAGLDSHGDVPDTAACATYREDEEWTSEWATIEAAVVDLVNVERSLGTDCPDGAGGSIVNDPLPVLAMSPELRCAAREHSYDMSTRDYYSNGTWDETADPCGGVDDVCAEAGYICRQQVSGVGEYRCVEGASLRIERAGYVHNGYFEGIGANTATASDLVATWMAHPGLCPGLMSAGFVDVGVGYMPGPGPGESRWTVILSTSQ